ncbi:MAG: CDP-alcohol phosphatidyltransferase family protein, partial [Oscillospiraceae bacterium]|nr:CDP-alcohol phosphatidyltransferase family protein [Oscillospiraceae bacterium]
KEVLDGIMNLTIIRKKGCVFAAVWHGKVTTILLYAMMLAHVIWPNISETVSVILITVSVLMMLLSLVLYTKKHIAILKYNESM